MIPLFRESDADGRRDLLEELLINAGLRAPTVGTNVVLDFGFWGRDERSALRSLGSDVGAEVEVVYLPIDEAVQRPIQQRFHARPEQTIPTTDGDLAEWRALFEEPTTHELTSPHIPDPPTDASSWAQGARRRWPSFG